MPSPLINHYSTKVVLGRGDNRATSYFLPEFLSKGSKAVKWTWMHCHSTKCRRWGKHHFLEYFKNRINFDKSRIYTIFDIWKNHKPSIGKFLKWIACNFWDNFWENLININDYWRDLAFLPFSANFFLAPYMLHHIGKKFQSSIRHVEKT